MKNNFVVLFVLVLQLFGIVFFVMIKFFNGYILFIHTQSFK